MWAVWLAVLIIALVIEFATADLVSIWFVGGAFVSLILALCGVNNLAITAPIFIAVSVGLLFGFRKMAMKKFNIGGTKTNAESVIGKEFELITPIGFNEAGTIKINGVVWSATTEDEKTEIKEGTIVKVISLKGNKYIVKEIK